LDLSVREWRCPSCQSINGRDENAAKNIYVVGASTARVRRCQTGHACNCCLSLESLCVHAREYVNHRLPSLDPVEPWQLLRTRTDQKSSGCQES
jgi:acetone carboxylase gamma subunit